MYGIHILWIRFFVFICLFINLLYHTVSVSGYMALDGRMIAEVSVGEDLEGSSYSLRYYPAFCLKGLIKPQKCQDSRC
jgi:hypothetical protein